MSINLELPGERRDPGVSETGVGEFADILGAEVISETYVGPPGRGRTGEVQVAEAEEDDVLELGWEGGIVELVRVGDLEEADGQAKRSAGGALSIPARRSVRSATRGTSDFGLDFAKHLRMKAIDQGTERLAGFAVPRVLRLIEEKRIPTPGLHRVAPNGELAGLVDGPLQGDRPFLVLVHGTFSSTQGGFKDLFGSGDDWKRLLEEYPGRILALEQHTVTESPAGNALQLMQGLPGRARLHLLSHSRGGLVGDLLCRHPFDSGEIEQFFDDPTYEGVRAQLEELRSVLNDKQPRVERFMRVASPAAGTLLASDRLGIYLNVFLSVLGKIAGPAAPAVEFTKSIASAIVSTGTRADQLPGIEAMRPDSGMGFVPFLNVAEPRGEDLAVIAGDVRGGGFFDRVKDFFATLYFREDNDFVVDSRSMFRGVPRNQALGYYYRAPRADHFSYFSEDDTRSRMVDWLTRGEARGLEPLTAGQAYGGLRAGPAVRAIPSNLELDKQRDPERPTVFLLPGIMGTHLAQDGDRQWLHPIRLAWGGLAKLAMKAEGVRRDGLIEMAYEKLFEHLRRRNHVIHFGYDWRRSIGDAAKLLAREVEVELQLHDNPVRIIAHSMGGLVARTLMLEHPEIWEEIKRRNGRLVMLGTPNFGSYVPAQVFTRDHKLLKVLAAADLRNDLDDLTRLVRTFPGLVQMLPKSDDTNLLERNAWRGLNDKFLPTATLLKEAKDFRARLDAAAVDPEHMIYVAGQAEATPAAMEVSESGANYLYTGRGDGTVPWDLGLLEGVDTYYVQAEHGQIPNLPSAFEGFVELLDVGRTRKLSMQAPVVKRGADELFTVESPEDEKPVRYFPNENDIYATLGGVPPDPDKELARPIKLAVTSGHVREAQYPVLVGHYKGDELVNAEFVIDRELGGQLSRDARLGRYPGARGTARVFRASGNLRGAVVVGLGEVGSLSRIGLEEALVAALSEYALANLAAPGEPMAALSISSLLIGTYGGTGIDIEDSMLALANAALTVNKLLGDQGLDERARILGIEFIELYLDVATRAAHAAYTIAQRLEGRVVARRHLVRNAMSLRSRPVSPYSSGWSRRLRIRREGDTLTYEFTTDLARSEPYRREIQWAHVESLLSTVQGADREAASTLFQYLLPFQLIEQAANMPDLVLDLDPESAAIPWEILDPFDNRSAGRDPLGVRVGLLRTLSTPDRRDNPRRASRRRALVIGEPGGVKPPLPGARQEGEHVAKLLEQHGMEIDRPFLLGESADAIFRALYRHEYEIVHIAAHGEFNEPSKASEGKEQAETPPSGVLLGGKRYIGPSEFENLRAVPSIVFLNCCHLGRMEQGGEALQPLRNPSRLAASVSEQLIKMGVGVVVAAGWAVGDAAAKLFADVFYRELLSGGTVLRAVAEARRRAFGRDGMSDLTWGAYQVYGDPGTTLNWAVSDEPGVARATRTFVAPHEVVDYVGDFAARSRVARDEVSRTALRRELETNEASLTPELKQNGETLAALGEAHENLGEYDAAIDRYETALMHSDSPLMAVERLANCQSRRAQAIAKDDAKAAEELFESALTRLKRLCEVSPSSERFGLIGAAWKRRARVSLDGVARKQHLERARDAYAQACVLNPTNLYYPLLNKVSLEMCLGRNGVLLEDIDEIERSAEGCGDEWMHATMADAGLIRFLLSGEGGVEQVAEKYLAAMRRSTHREEESMKNQIDALVELALEDGIKELAAQVRDAVANGQIRMG